MTFNEITDPRVLAAMRKVPRQRFVLPQNEGMAQANIPLPIGHGQTISQPSLVAVMTQMLAIRYGDKVLEVGAGSGYQTAILAELTNQVYTIEILPALAMAAEQRLLDLGYEFVHVRNADGYFGWPEHAPYDAIIVTAAAAHIPQPLVDQLKDGGRMVIPVGQPDAVQMLWFVEKQGGEVRSHQVFDVQFVPLTGQR